MAPCARWKPRSPLLPPPPAFKRSQHAPRGPRAGHTPMVNPVPAAFPPAQSPGPGTALLALGHPSPFSCRRRGTLHRWPQPVPCLPRLRLNFPPAPPLPAGPAATPARLTSSRRLHAALQPPTSPRLAHGPPAAASRRPHAAPAAAATPGLSPDDEPAPPPPVVAFPLLPPPLDTAAPGRTAALYQLQEHGDSKDLKSQVR
ncbi:uncharacterized protein LOC141730050 [Zonotrichia albicollis]|uniref:uncharacterized protein LOC141730050 n=1 Tax=Zonotrichia albicollis TaxID=44394 RepID=UPI003D80D4B2